MARLTANMAGVGRLTRGDLTRRGAAVLGEGDVGEFGYLGESTFLLYDLTFGGDTISSSSDDPGESTFFLILLPLGGDTISSSSEGDLGETTFLLYLLLLGGDTISSSSEDLGESTFLLYLLTLGGDTSSSSEGNFLLL